MRITQHVHDRPLREEPHHANVAWSAENLLRLGESYGVEKCSKIVPFSIKNRQVQAFFHILILNLEKQGVELSMAHHVHYILCNKLLDRHSELLYIDRSISNLQLQIKYNHEFINLHFSTVCINADPIYKRNLLAKINKN